MASKLFRFPDDGATFDLTLIFYISESKFYQKGDEEFQKYIVHFKDGSKLTVQEPIEENTREEIISAWEAAIAGASND